MTKAVYRPKTANDVEYMFDMTPCKVCPNGQHLVNFPPGSVQCPTCDPLPDGRPRRHYHRRPHPRRRIRHYIEGKWTS